MKSASFIFYCVLATPIAAEFREWTDAESGRAITAKPIQKSMAKDRIELKLDSGKIVWIEISRLVEEDQKYADNWERLEDLITTKTLRFGRKNGRAWKDVKVTARGGATGGKVRLFSKSDHPRPKVHPIKPGETAIYEFRGYDTWEVELIYEDTVLDRESDKNKTGERER